MYLFTWLSGKDTLTVFSGSSRDVDDCNDLLPELLFERDKTGAFLFVAPRPAKRLLSNDGERAHINACNEDTVNTPNLFNVIFVALDTRVKRIWNVAHYNNFNNAMFL